MPSPIPSCSTIYFSPLIFMYSGRENKFNVKKQKQKKQTKIHNIIHHFNSLGTVLGHTLTFKMCGWLQKTVTSFNPYNLADFSWLNINVFILRIVKLQN